LILPLVKGSRKVFISKRAVVHSATGLLFAAMFCLGNASVVNATMQRNPTGVNVATSGPTTLTIRFADSAAASFTTTDAYFCSVDPTGGAGVANANTASCGGSGGVLLGRLPLALDRGSSSTSKSSITDIMTIPYSVARRSVVLAQKGQFSDFFYVRKFSPVGAANLGAGAGVPVLVVVTCRLTGGTARTPLSLTNVLLYGSEPELDGPNLQIRLNEANLKKGNVYARIEFTGQGILSGYWEVRTPGDQEIRTIDRYTAGSLTESERDDQRHYTKVKYFRVNMPLSGRITLKGPSYNELPRFTPGRHEIMLRIEAAKDKEAMSSLASAGGTTNLFSGAAAGFPLPTLEYFASPNSTERKINGALFRLIRGKTADGAYQFSLAWDKSQADGYAIVIEVSQSAASEGSSVLVPYDNAYKVLPRSWWASIANKENVKVTVYNKYRKKVLSRDVFYSGGSPQ
jgi:hypothetical protein